MDPRSVGCILAHRIDRRSRGIRIHALDRAIPWVVKRRAIVDLGVEHLCDGLAVVLVHAAGRARAQQRNQQQTGNRIAGPALIEEYASTTLLLPGDVLEVDAFGNLAIRLAG